MLPSFIIDQIRRREDDERRRQDAPVRELELPLPMPRDHRPAGGDDEPERGVVIIDLGA
ncbi:MAG: hypothetical protein VYE22_03995 [Myxococcota bacterium]|nr:hypothetical protein [Myxococcota bacterium]